MISVWDPCWHVHHIPPICLEFILNQEELWEGINSSLLDHDSNLMADVNIIILIKMTQLTLEIDLICQIVSLGLEFHGQPIWHILFSITVKLFWYVADLPNGALSTHSPPNTGVTLHASQRVHPGAALQLCWQHRNFPSTKNPLWYLISRSGLPLISGEQAGRKHNVSKHWPKRRNTSVSAVISKQWQPHFASNQCKSKWFPKDISLSLRS